MKHLIALLLAVFMVGTASAQTTEAGAAQKTAAESNSKADAAATNNGNTQAIVIEAAQPLADTTARVVYSGKQTVNNVPSVSGPPLTTSNDTCMGSTSGSVNIAGLGIGGGTTWTDTNCKRLKNSRELWNMGMKAASLALMCKDPENREALEVTGYECPDTEKARKNAESKVGDYKIAQADGVQYTDPIVRARLGLPALTK